MATSTTAGPSSYRPAAVHPGDDAFVPLATEIGEDFATRAAEHDRDNSFVSENFARMREDRYLALAVPEELGGLGASMRQVCYAQAELARHDASTALAVNMHLYLTLANVFRWRKGIAGADAVLKRIAQDGIVLMTSGGSDGLWPSATAIKDDGGYRINGRKMFCSQAPVANVLTTMAAYEDPEEGTIVLAISVPTTSEGLSVVDTWDTLGMRATSSHDLQLDNVFVGDAQIVARRPWGRVDPVLRNAAIHFAPPVAAVYFGIASGARDEAVRVVSQRKNGEGRPLAEDPVIQRQIGLMDTKLRTAWWSLLGALEEIGDDYALDDQTVSTLMVTKRQIVTDAIEVVDLAMDVVGGSAYYKRSPLERAYRDVRAGTFHPFTPEKTLVHAGRLALGQPVDTLW